MYIIATKIYMYIQFYTENAVKKNIKINATVEGDKIDIDSFGKS